MALRLLPPITAENPIKKQLAVCARCKKSVLEDWFYNWKLHGPKCLLRIEGERREMIEKGCELSWEKLNA